MAGFQFKQFYVEHGGCAMKVGTDGTLLGAWCPVPNPTEWDVCAADQSGHIRILDVGTGSGLIALMLAQRCEAGEIDAIDLDEQAVEQARYNFERSAWAERLHAQHSSLQAYVSGRESTYHLVVSNPPYFQNSLKNPDAQRTLARHTDTLSYTELVDCGASLLAEEGILALVAPQDEEAHLLRLMAQHGLHVMRVSRFYTSMKEGKPAKRVLIAAKKGGLPLQPAYKNLYLGSEEYQDLVRAFYL